MPVPPTTNLERLDLSECFLVSDTEADFSQATPQYSSLKDLRICMSSRCIKRLLSIMSVIGLEALFINVDDGRQYPIEFWDNMNRPCEHAQDFLASPFGLSGSQDFRMLGIYSGHPHFWRPSVHSTFLNSRTSPSSGCDTSVFERNSSMWLVITKHRPLVEPPLLFFRADCAHPVDHLTIRFLGRILGKTLQHVSLHRLLAGVDRDYICAVGTGGSHRPER